jgi:hypothetical protein
MFRRLSGSKKKDESPKSSNSKTTTKQTAAAPAFVPVKKNNKGGFNNGDDDDIPPPPDDDDVPPPPPPSSSSTVTAKPLGKPSSSAANLPPKAPSPANRTPSPANQNNHTERPRSGTKPKFLDEDDGDTVDPVYVDMTVVPILLRSKFAYDEANKFGTAIKKLHDSDVKIFMTNAQHLCEKIKSSGIKTPTNWEKAIVDDAFWSQGGAKGNRKSFVYYAPETTTDRPKSDSKKVDSEPEKKPHNRNRASFSGGPQPVISNLDEGDANRYKVTSRRDKAESVSKDLADLVAELGALEAGSKKS